MNRIDEPRLARVNKVVCLSVKSIEEYNFLVLFLYISLINMLKRFPIGYDARSKGLLAFVAKSACSLLLSRRLVSRVLFV